MYYLKPLFLKCMEDNVTIKKKKSSYTHRSLTQSKYMLLAQSDVLSFLKSSALKSSILALTAPI